MQSKAEVFCNGLASNLSFLIVVLYSLGGAESLATLPLSRKSGIKIQAYPVLCSFSPEARDCKGESLRGQVQVRSLQVPQSLTCARHDYVDYCLNEELSDLWASLCVSLALFFSKNRFSFSAPTRGARYRALS